MKRTFSHLLIITLLTTTLNLFGANLPRSFGRSFFAQRPQGQNQPRLLSGEVGLYPLCSDQCYSNVSAAVVEYTDNFNRDAIGSYMFFNGKNSMVFAGSGTPPGIKDVDAINFFLADDFWSRVEAFPRVQNCIVDFHTRHNLNDIWNGLYCEIDLPVAWTQWSMDLKETITNTGTTIAQFQLGNPATSPAPVNSVIEAWKGTAESASFPLITRPLQFAKIDGSEKTIALADARFLLGYNVLCTNCYHLAVNLRAVAPTGTRPRGEYVFEPVSGNGRHIELGGGIQGHYVLWSNDCDSWFSFWIDGYLNHFFTARQKRTFDWSRNGVGSRYLWIKEFASDGVTVNSLVRGPNITTLNCDVQARFVGEATILFDFAWRNWIVDFGYNAWGRSAEEVTIVESIKGSTYAIKGDTDGNNNEIAQNTQINGANGQMTGVFSASNSLKTSDLDPYSAAAPSAVAQKFFISLTHTWHECTQKPFIGIGCETEWAARSKENRALDQWGVWFKGGCTLF